MVETIAPRPSHGLSTYHPTLGCSELNLTDSLALAARHSVDALELRALGSTLDLPSYLATHHGSPESLSRELSEPGARIAVFDTSLRLTGASAAERENFLEFIPWAEGLGVRWLRVFDGAGGSDAVGRADALDTLRWWRELRDRAGWRVEIIVETHDSLLDAQRIIDFSAAAPGIKLLWDAHHTWKLGGEDPVATWRAIASHVAHIHVKDSVSRAYQNYSYTYVLPGSGEFPMAALACALHTEYSDGVSLEWERLWHPYLPPLESALAAANAAGWW